MVGYDVCGKTGTAQPASTEYAKSHGLKNNAWFVGFAPRSKPEIVVVALFENGEHGPNAAPIVRDVMKAYFDKKLRVASMQKGVPIPMPDFKPVPLTKEELAAEADAEREDSITIAAPAEEEKPVTPVDKKATVKKP